MNTIRRLMNILWGIPILFVLIGAFFKLQHYPYGSKLLGIGLVSGLIMGVFEIVRLMMTINDEE